MAGYIRYALLLTAVGLSTFQIGEPVFAHKWVDASGKSSVEAEFVGLEDGAVKLKKADGRIISVQLDKLSEESRDQAKQLAKSTSSGPQESSAPKHASDPSTETPTPSRSANRTSSVTAEGVGATPDDALKDAFRNAVRQVVGAVVDGETLVKNDEIIKDKVLTYSDGFIKSYKEVEDSKRIENGLHRVRITAGVERRNVIAKLKAANVTVADVYGKDLFAKVVTDAEAKENATALLNKALADLPTLLTAEVVGKKVRPEYDASTHEIVLTISVKPDLKAYDVFARHLRDTLGKVAIDKGFSITTKGKLITTMSGSTVASPHKTAPRSTKKQRSSAVAGLPAKPKSQADQGSKSKLSNDAHDDNGSIIYAIEQSQKEFALLGPPIAEQNKDAWCIWICSSKAENSNLSWSGYVVDADKDEVLDGILIGEPDIRAKKPISRGESKASPKASTIVSLQFIGSDQKLIIKDEFELFGNSFRRFLSGGKKSAPTYLNLLRQKVFRDFAGIRMEESISQSHKDSETLNFLIAPYSFAIMHSPRGLQLAWQTEQTYPRRIEATLDQLKQIETVRCNVIYRSSNE